MHIEFGLTSFSQKEVQAIINRSLSYEEALSYLEQDIHIRTFRETLSGFYNEDIKKKLTDGLLMIEKTANKESISRKVRNWLNGKNEPDSREDFIKICFALGLGEQQANSFLSLTTEGGFHLRNPRELAFIYCLRTGKSYDAAISLLEGLKPLEKKAEPNHPKIFTKEIADLFEHVCDDEAFQVFYTQKYNALGVMHNTAYYKSFLPFLNTLIRPDVASYFKEERKYTVDEVVNKYLRMGIPLDKKTANLTVIQKTIRKFWPSATSIIRMKNREEDVSRKILMLLYMVTGGIVVAEDSAVRYDSEEELSEEERFEQYYWALSAMLQDCGMSRLDPRNVFDWLVLYCLKTKQEEAISDRLQAIINKIFALDRS